MKLRFLIDELAAIQDLVNQALEVFECADGSLEIVLYEIPDAYSPPSG